VRRTDKTVRKTDWTKKRTYRTVRSTDLTVRRTDWKVRGKDRTVRRMDWTVRTSVPDPKLIISDPDPQTENQEFRIRILL